MCKSKMSATGFICLILLIFPVTFAAQGKKYGLFVGVSDYQKQKKPLPASVRDASAVREVLIDGFGFPEAGTRLLTDRQATRENVLKAIGDYQKIIAKDDLFVFYFSGHGTLFPDRFSKTPDEENKVFIPRGSNLKMTTDNYDSAIVPFAADEKSGEQWRGLILDDELFELFEGFAKKQARVVFISDSCSSGTLAKSYAPFEATPSKNKKEIPTKSIGWREATGIDGEDELKETAKTASGNVSKPVLNGFYIMIASSADNEVSVPVNPVTGDEMSLFTYCFLEKLKEYQKSRKNFTFETVLKEISPAVKSFAKEQYDFSQTPRLDTRFYQGSLNVLIF